MSDIMKHVGMDWARQHKNKTATEQMLQYHDLLRQLDNKLSNQMQHSHSVDAGAGQHSHSVGAHTTNTYASWRDVKRQLVYMRLDLPLGSPTPFAFFDFMQGEECVYVMVAKTNKEKPIIIEDDSGLFPSDTLVTQLRMMIG